MPDSAASLIEIIEITSKKAHVKSLDISFNELLDMVGNNELDIEPDYQRLFRWTESQQSRFIESLILEMPVPPIFVIQEETGKYQLIDGLQRISSYLHLRGKLDTGDVPIDNKVKMGDKLVLVDCDIVPELNGKAFEDLPAATQIRLKRSFIRVEAVQATSDPHFKYHMFKRLNVGGNRLSEQQVRNCAIRMLDKKFPDLIVDLSSDANFVTCTEGLTNERILSAVNEELVLKFFAFKNKREDFKHAVGDFLTDYMEQVSDPAKTLSFDYSQETQTFRKTFEVLASSLAEKAFAMPNKARTAISAGFSMYHFESITMGLQSVLPKLFPGDALQMTKLKDVLTEIKLDPGFISITTGGGKNSPGLLAARIGFVEKGLLHAFS
jgi:hypothetical protein